MSHADLVGKLCDPPWRGTKSLDRYRRLRLPLMRQLALPGGTAAWRYRPPGQVRAEQPAPVWETLRKGHPPPTEGAPTGPDDLTGSAGIDRVNGNRKPHICGNRKLHTSGEDVSGGADILPVMPVGRVELDAGSGATGVLANTRREAAEPAVTWRLPHAVRPTLSSASADAPASGSCCPGC